MRLPDCLVFLRTKDFKSVPRQLQKGPHTSHCAQDYITRCFITSPHDQKENIKKLHFVCQARNSSLEVFTSTRNKTANMFKTYLQNVTVNMANCINFLAAFKYSRLRSNVEDMFTECTYIFLIRVSQSRFLLRFKGDVGEGTD